MEKRRVLFVTIAIFAALLLIKTTTSLRDTWKYRFSCILCNITFRDETYYSSATVSPDNINVAYFKTEVSYINQDPIFDIFIGEGSSAKQYYKSEKISLCTNNLEANSENCFKELRNKTWSTPVQRDLSKEKASVAPLFWDKDGSIIYGYNEGRYSSVSIFQPTYTIVGKIDVKTHADALLSNDYESFHNFWVNDNIYNQYINPSKILVSGDIYGGGQFGRSVAVYLIDTETKTVRVYIVDPKRKSTFRMSTYLNYEFFRKNLNDSRLK